MMKIGSGTAQIYGEEDLAAGPCGAAEARHYGGRAAAQRCGAGRWLLEAEEQERTERSGGKDEIRCHLSVRGIYTG